MKMLRRKGFFLFTLPLFFVLHGFVENYDFVPAKDAALLLGIYILASLAITALAWLFFRNGIKAALFSAVIMALHFFFGSLHDFLKGTFPGSFITRYTILLPLLALLLVGLVIYLKRTKKPFHKLTFFLNIFFAILILFDLVILATSSSSKKHDHGEMPEGLFKCSNCPTPDIYFILADEYPGAKALKEVFGYDNSAFIDSLGKLGFQTASSSTSNYNYTPFALASILDMDYLELSGTGRGKTDLAYCYRKIRDNRVLHFLEAHGYVFHNYSVFDFEGQPARTRETFLPAKTRLITSQTLLSRIDRDIRFNLVTRFKSKRNQQIITYANRDNNEHLISLTKELAATKASKPRFVYTHLMLPHYPYYYDSLGREMPYESLLEGNQVNQQAFINYLKYANTRLLDLIRYIRNNSASPPVIILIGDHGFRHFTQPVKQEHYFQNLLSVHLPGAAQLPIDSISGVNVFRAFLNEQFKQRLPLLPDSTLYLDD